MSIPSPEDRAQIARVRWLLQLTGQAVQISGFTDKVIDILAPAMADVMQAEGVVLVNQGVFDDEIRAMEAGAT